MQALLSRINDETLRRRHLEANRQVTVSEAEAAAFHESLIGRVTVDWRAPDYDRIFAHRETVLAKIREDRSVIPILKAHYKLQPADFIDDWGCTVDPRNVEIGLPAKMPFILFPKQRDWLEFILRKWRHKEPGLTEKSRDCGLSWLAISTSCTLCLHYTGVAIGFGSRKEEYVDKNDAPKSLFWKGRKFMENLPPEFNGGWNSRTDSPHLRMTFRETESNISGEAGANIGRGDRTSIYFVDEAAHIPEAKAIEASLAQTTNCRQDISSVKGRNNVFAEKRFSGKVEVFIFDWRDDPRKDQAWYEKQVAELDPVTVAQEIDRDYAASVEGIIIPAAWVKSAIDAHVHLNFTDDGGWSAGLDVADEGADANALTLRKGVVLRFADDWREGDTGETTRKAVPICAEHAPITIQYDCIGVGAGVKAEANRLAQEKLMPRGVSFSPWNAGASVLKPDDHVIPGDTRTPLNRDYYGNLKAQAWWNLRMRFLKVHRMRTEPGVKFPVAELISLSSRIPKLRQLEMELSQPVMTKDGRLRMIVDKTPTSTKSPNLADSTVMNYFPVKLPMIISNAALQRFGARVA